MSSVNTLFPGQPPRFDPHITITTNIDIDLNDSNRARDDVDRILSASAVALNSLPKNHDSLIKLGKINSQRKFFKKLYFQIGRDPNLLSFARIIRELFVILPQITERENQIQNPHLFTTDSHGNIVRKSSLKKSKVGSPEPERNLKPLDIAKIQQESAATASDWSTNEFDPHLSLVYSDIYPIDNALWRTIKTRIQDYLNVDNCDSDDVDNNGLGLGWDGGVLKLVLCEGDVSDWITLGSVDVH